MNINSHNNMVKTNSVKIPCPNGCGLVTNPGLLNRHTALCCFPNWKCRECGFISDNDDDFKKGKSHRGRENICKPCARKLNVERQRPNREKINRQAVERRLQTKYGISIEERDRLIEEQGGVCLICLKVPKRFVVDHNHKTDEYRGMLCVVCNSRIIKLENPEILERAAAYLRERGWDDTQGV